MTTIQKPVSLPKIRFCNSNRSQRNACDESVICERRAPAAMSRPAARIRSAWCRTRRILPQVPSRACPRARVRGERDDRNVARLWIVLQSSRRLPAVDHRHFEIHQDDVGALAQRHRTALLAIWRRHNVEIAQQLEPHLEHVDVVVVVLDVEYFGHDAASIPLSRAPASPACGLMSSLEPLAGASMRPGRRTVKTEPSPGSLATVTSPPI